MKRYLALFSVIYELWAGSSRWPINYTTQYLSQGPLWRHNTRKFIQPWMLSLWWCQLHFPTHHSTLKIIFYSNLVDVIFSLYFQQHHIVGHNIPVYLPTFHLSPDRQINILIKLMLGDLTGMSIYNSNFFIVVSWWFIAAQRVLVLTSNYLNVKILVCAGKN